MKKLLLSVFLLFLLLGNFLFSSDLAFAKEEKVNITFFYSATCTHCKAEEVFLSKLENIYPKLTVTSYLDTNPDSSLLLKSLLKEHGAEKYFGSVPLTFVEDALFIGFDNEDGVGKKIENAIQKSLAGLSAIDPSDNDIKVPFLGEINVNNYSLPILTIILGFLDGFNVCSLGALIFILGLVLALKSRKKILIYGGIFLLTTSIIYGLLIFLWYKLFSFFSSYLVLMNIVVGLVALIGSAYFWKQLIKFKKQGVTCESDTNKTVNKMTQRLSSTLNNKKNIFLILGSILIFAVIITIIEFPCSAAVPLVFAGILSQANLGPFQHFFYISLFLLLYLLDELVVFFVAFFTMKIWLSSQKATVWVTAIEAIILMLLGIYYLLTIVL